MTKTINILASDFENNSWYNINDGMDGCPIKRAKTRAGIDKEEMYFVNVPKDIQVKVFKMFKGEIPIEDFSFEM